MTEADIRSIANRFTAQPEAYRESRRRAGVTLERLPSPMRPPETAELFNRRGFSRNRSSVMPRDALPGLVSGATAPGAGLFPDRVKAENSLPATPIGPFPEPAW